ncbi:MAG: SDR family NAD(P)-dependent oxidoreductase [Neisseriaceae bacterium]|nr:MAG: SDR family NAD(P)-dependent oxidoreductase [Neisseriaceae bacterium]
MSYDLKGKNVLITGAAMGMGRIYALRSAQEKASNIILWDINQEQLEKTAEEVRAKGAIVYTNVVDLGQLEEIERAAKETKALPNVSSLDVLINNAGVVSGNNYFWNMDNKKDIYFTMSINALAPMYVTNLFIDDMIADKSTEKRILNVASAAGLVSNPNMSVYVASKWSCLGWSDSFRLELKKSGNKHIKVTTFCPTYISTGMFYGVKGMLLTPVITPETAVDVAWKGMKKGTPIVYKPLTVRLSGVLKGILPTGLWDWVAENVIGIYSSMEDFKGHSNR